MGEWEGMRMGKNERKCFNLLIFCLNFIGW
jgi:hypothetical protein